MSPYPSIPESAVQRELSGIRSDLSVLTARVDAGCIVHPATIDPWRFDTARNLALDLLPDTVDWCITLDADEVLAPCDRPHQFVKEAA